MEQGGYTMLIVDEIEYNKIWKKVEKILKFHPSCNPIDTVLPFKIKLPHSVYSIKNMNNEQLVLMDDIIRQALINITLKNEKWYALDWKHAAFRFDPNNLDEQQNVYIKDEQYIGGGYNAYFPPFYPDGDYYFFIDENFNNGYLGHPWRKEVWIFGDMLTQEFSKVFKKLGWHLLSERRY